MIRKALFAFLLAVGTLYAEYEVDFDRMMGKGTALFDRVQTQEDWENLRVFRKYYHQNLQSILSKEVTRIPKAIHFVWCGPQSFSKKMLKNMNSWIQKHPDWTIKLWSDRDHRLPHPKMQFCRIDQFPWKHLEHKYKSTLNYAEREELLGYEILLQQGGVCVHPSVACKRSFTQLHRDYDLYAFASKPHISCASSTVMLDPSLIASAANHPKIKRVIKNVLSSWVSIEEDFSIDAQDSQIYRTLYRTRLALDQVFKEQVDQPSRDIIFPAGLLYKVNGKAPFLAHVKNVKEAFKGEISFEEKVDKQMDAILRKEQKLLLMHLVLIGTLIAGFFVLFKKNYI